MTQGSYARTLEAIHWASEFGLPIQVNTSISKRNVHDLENMANLLKQFKLVLWSAFLSGAHRTRSGSRPSFSR
jgi:AdoMet-dependent heme synthase